MSPKYQIFISSTYEDLKAERDQVIKAVLEMGHIPVGMEMFSAADEEQWKIIQRQIDSSDYYVVIVAHRYGSMTEGISYTEKEYDYAVSQSIPALGFVIDGTAEWPHEKYDTEAKKKKAMELFKKKVKAKPVNFWKSADDLHAKVAVALMKTFNTQPRPGWIRADTSIGPEVSEEIARLSRENSDLQKQLNTLSASDYKFEETNKLKIQINENDFISLSIENFFILVYNLISHSSKLYTIRELIFSITTSIAKSENFNFDLLKIKENTESIYHAVLNLAGEDLLRYTNIQSGSSNPSFSNNNLISTKRCIEPTTKGLKIYSKIYLLEKQS